MRVRCREQFRIVVKAHWTSWVPGRGGGGGAGGGGGSAGLVLSSFSQPYKLSPATLHAWAAALRRLPAATSLALLDFQPGGLPHLRAELAALGVRAARLRAWPVRGRAEHLARAAAAALSLDSPGYNQGTSGLDALWAGLPLLSLPLSQWCGRMGLGLLRGVALLPGAVHTRREIEDGVVALGRDDLATSALSLLRPAELSPWPRPRRGRQRDGRPVPQPIEVIL